MRLIGLLDAAGSPRESRAAPAGSPVGSHPSRGARLGAWPGHEFFCLRFRLQPVLEDYAGQATGRDHTHGGLDE
eukprot:904792-Pyramimonas_sp.AAC.1